MTLSDKLEVVKDKKETLKAKSENNTAKQLAYGTEPFLFELGSLCAYLSKVRDGRKARGKRYTLTTILTLLILGKMSGYDQAEAIADGCKSQIVSNGRKNAGKYSGSGKNSDGNDVTFAE